MRRDAAEESNGELRRECRTFTRYLTGREPDEYVLTKYVGLQAAVVREAPPILPIDRVLLRAAASSASRTRLADVYARVFRPQSLLRRKLILAFAILENSGAYHRQFTSGGPGTLTAAVIGIVGSLAAFGVVLVLSILSFAPRHAWLAVRGDGLE
jgi:hypothetical protein